jgi:hypothetical protein
MKKKKYKRYIDGYMSKPALPSGEVINKRKKHK